LAECGASEELRRVAKSGMGVSPVSAWNRKDGRDTRPTLSAPSEELEKFLLPNRCAQRNSSAKQKNSVVIACIAHKSLRICERCRLNKQLAYTPFGVLKNSKLWAKLLTGKEEIVVDTMTYASVAILPWSIAQDRAHPVLPEVEIIQLDFSMIKR
jgi:hypothetical protein